MKMTVSIRNMTIEADNTVISRINRLDIELECDDSALTNTLMDVPLASILKIGEIK